MHICQVSQHQLSNVQELYSHQFLSLMIIMGVIMIITVIVIMIIMGVIMLVLKGGFAQMHIRQVSHQLSNVQELYSHQFLCGK